MNQPINQVTTGTCTGTILVLLMQVTGSELLKTALFAALGSVISFMLSYIIKYCLKWWRNH